MELLSIILNTEKFSSFRYTLLQTAEPIGFYFLLQGGGSLHSHNEDICVALWTYVWDSHNPNHLISIYTVTTFI